MFYGIEEKEGWDEIVLNYDRDTGEKNVKGRITASVGWYLGVCLSSLKNNNEERHQLVSRADYLPAAQRFESTRRAEGVMS